MLLHWSVEDFLLGSLLWSVVEEAFSLVSITPGTVTRSGPPFSRPSHSPSSRPRTEGGLQVRIQVRTPAVPLTKTNVFTETTGLDRDVLRGDDTENWLSENFRDE